MNPYNPYSAYPSYTPYLQQGINNVPPVVRQCITGVRRQWCQRAKHSSKFKCVGVGRNCADLVVRADG